MSFVHYELTLYGTFDLMMRERNETKTIPTLFEFLPTPPEQGACSIRSASALKRGCAVNPQQGLEAFVNVKEILKRKPRGK